MKCFEQIIRKTLRISQNDDIRVQHRAQHQNRNSDDHAHQKPIVLKKQCKLRIRKHASCQNTPSIQSISVHKQPLRDPSTLASSLQPKIFYKLESNKAIELKQKIKDVCKLDQIQHHSWIKNRLKPFQYHIKGEDADEIKRKIDNIQVQISDIELKIHQYKDYFKNYLRKDVRIKKDKVLKIKVPVVGSNQSIKNTLPASPTPEQKQMPKNIDKIQKFWDKNKLNENTNDQKLVQLSAIKQLIFLIDKFQDLKIVNKQNKILDDIFLKKGKRRKLKASELIDINEVLRHSKMSASLIKNLINRLDSLDSSSLQILINNLQGAFTGNQNLERHIDKILQNIQNENVETSMFDAILSSIEDIQSSKIQIQNANSVQRYQKRNKQTSLKHQVRPKNINIKRSSIDYQAKNQFRAGELQTDKIFKSKKQIFLKSQANLKSIKRIVTIHKIPEKNTKVKSQIEKDFKKNAHKQKQILGLTKKKINFATEIKLKDNRKLLTYSIRSIKKQISWDESNLKNFQSIKTLKSFRTITSNQSSKLIKTSHSLKSIRKRYKHGNQIWCIRKYRSKVFGRRLLSQNSSILDLSHQFKNQRNDKQITSLSKFIGTDEMISQKKFKKTNIKLIQDYAGEDKNKNAIKYNESDHTIQKQNLISYQRKNKRNLCQFEMDDKKNILRQALMNLKQIQIEGNILSKMRACMHELNRLYEAGLIDQKIYQQYERRFLKRKSRKIQLCENNIQKREEIHPYKQLVEIVPTLSKTIELNQINKYYYHQNKFNLQQNEIIKTNRIRQKDEELFSIRANIIINNQRRQKIFIKQIFKQNSELLFQISL